MPRGVRPVAARPGSLAPPCGSPSPRSPACSATSTPISRARRRSSARPGRTAATSSSSPSCFSRGYALGQVDEDVSMPADDPRLTALSALVPHDRRARRPLRGRPRRAQLQLGGVPQRRRARPHAPQALPADLRRLRGAQALLPRPVDARLRHPPRADGDAHLQRRLAAAPRLPRRAGRRARAARADELVAEPLSRALRLA